jgi:hypothetical protein
MLIKPLLDAGQLQESLSSTRAVQAALLCAAIMTLSACNLPFDLGQPTTRSLENGVVDGLTNATGFAVNGTYTGANGKHWQLAVSIERPGREVLSLKGPVALDAIVVAGQGYYRGQAFLAQHMGSDPDSLTLVRAAGNAWWKGGILLVPTLPDLLEGAAFRATFLGSNVTRRTDHVSAGGQAAVELSGPRADVFVQAAPPYYVLHLTMKRGVLIDGLGAAELDYGSFNGNIQITAPADVIDFSNLSTLPPIYTVVSVDTSGCGSPCVVSAQLKNLGGLNGAKSPSTVTFTMKGAASGAVLGTCEAPVTPDVGYNATTTVSCTMSLSGQPENAAVVTATADNPGHA